MPAIKANRRTLSQPLLGLIICGASPLVSLAEDSIQARLEFTGSDSFHFQVDPVDGAANYEIQMSYDLANWRRTDLPLLGGNEIEAFKFDVNRGGFFRLKAYPAPRPPSVAIAAGIGNSLIVRADGSLWVTGNNFDDQLIIRDDRSIEWPREALASAVSSVAGGQNHSLILKTDGSVWSVGANHLGQLGDGTFEDRAEPVEILASGGVAIRANLHTSLILKSDGSLWGMGENTSSQLGDSTQTNRATPTRIVSSGVISMSIGLGYILILKEDHSVWACGSGAWLGRNWSQLNSSVPTKRIDSGILAIEAGWNHQLFIKEDHSLWVTGKNSNGEFGIGTKNEWFHNTDEPMESQASGVTKAAAGRNFSLFIKEDGSLWATGYNRYGQLGNGKNENDYASLLESCEATPFMVERSGVVDVAIGQNHAIYLKDDGTIWGMGNGISGELGDGERLSQKWPIKMALP